jgi:cell division protein FtsI/penicillin-binding protein 2
MREMLERVVIDGTGKRAAVDGYRVAGKTGTAEKFSLEEGDYGERYTTVFAGFAPVDNPRVTVVVVLDEPTEHGASQTAAPVFSQITDSTLSTLGVAKGG